MLIPKSALIATAAEEDVEPYDGSVLFVEAVDDPDMVIIDGAVIANQITPEAESPYEPTFESLDEEWLVEDD